MFDTRICRGSTLKLEKIRSRLIKCDQKNKSKRFKKRAFTPPPVNGRTHVSVQTDETLCDLMSDPNNYFYGFIDDDELVTKTYIDSGDGEIYENERNDFTKWGKDYIAIHQKNPNHVTSQEDSVRIANMAQALVRDIEWEAMNRLVKLNV